MLIRLIATLGMANFALIMPLSASAQDVPSYAQGEAPQYAQQGQQPSYATQDQQLHGRVIAFDGAYGLQVRDDQGYIDNVQLHQGTVINPTGLTLASGMVVSVNGYSQGNAFAANEIDTPYTYYNAVPYYGGYPWYHYDSGITLGFFFGDNDWWHGDYYGRPAYFDRGCRTYNVGLYFGGGYGGEWHGRDYVAPYNAGGYTPNYHGSYRSTQGYAPQNGGGYRAPAPSGGGYRSTQGVAPSAPVNTGGYRSPQGYAPGAPVNGGGYRSPQGYAPGAPVNRGGYRSSQGYAPGAPSNNGGGYRSPQGYAPTAPGNYGGGYRSPQGSAPSGRAPGAYSGGRGGVAPRAPISNGRAPSNDERHPH